MQRLADNGYTVVKEKYFYGENYHEFSSLHATYEQIINFPANEYGFFFFFYDERKEMNLKALT